MKLSIDEEVTQAFAHADHKSAAAKATPADVRAVIEEILREASWGEERSGKKANWDETSIEARLFTKREGWIRVYFFGAKFYFGLAVIGMVNPGVFFYVRYSCKYGAKFEFLGLNNKW